MSDIDGSGTDRSATDGADTNGYRPDAPYQTGGPQQEGADDTIEIRRDPSLTDDLLGPDRPSGEESARRPLITESPMATWVEPVEDDEDYYEPPKRRSRLTTGLVVALIFLLGMFTGVTVSRLLPSQQRPQVVYLLNNDGSSQTPGGTPSGMPTDVRPRGLGAMPSGAPSGR